MVDDWLLEHLAKVTTLSCVLIVVYFLIYSIWRISQMPNYPWNWNEWHWPLGGRHAVEIYRKPAEMPFILSLDESSAGKMGGCTFTLSYLKEKSPPEITVMWGPGVNYLMRLINLPWEEFNRELMKEELQPGEWKSSMGAAGSSDSELSWRETLNYFILQRVQLDVDQKNKEERRQSTTHSVLSEAYNSIKFQLSPPTVFDWGLLRNQFRYPAAIFITDSSTNQGRMSVDEVYEINGIIQIFHVKNEIFQNASTKLAQYIKMNNGQTHMLQSLYVMDDHRTSEDSECEDDDDGDGAQENNDLSSSLPEPPFRDILCSVCQVSPVTRVIIPCRHVCLCTKCFEKVETCPICRGNIMYYFRTRQEPRSSSSGNSNDESQNYTWWQKLERFNERFSDAVGLIRQY